MKITVARRSFWQRLKEWLLRRKVKTSFGIVLKKMVLTVFSKKSPASLGGE